MGSCWQGILTLTQFVRVTRSCDPVRGVRGDPVRGPLFAKEAGLPIVAALDDVQWNAIKLDAGAAGHEFMLAQNN
jgi:hypothetical protein